jgi:hypothetical protein
MGAALLLPAPVVSAETDASKLPPVPDELWRQLGKKKVADWLRCPRFYTRDGLPYTEGEGTSRTRRIAANEGNVFRLGVFWGGRARYQSSVAPHYPEMGSVDYFREALDEGKRKGVRILTYINPNSLYTDHPLYPECAIRTYDGSVWNVDTYGIKNTRYACINNPKYRRFLLDVITEIFTKYESAGLYIDGLTPHTCFCEHCKAKYRQMFDAEMPAKFEKHGTFCVLWEMVSRPELRGDPRDPDSQRYTDFLYKSLTDITRDFTETVKRHRPDAVVVYHSWPKPDIFEYYDATLSEIYIERPWVHTLWKDAELASYAAVFGMPILQNIYLQHKTDAEARHKMVQALANGVLPNCWHFNGMKTVYEFMCKNAAYFDYARGVPVKFLAFPRAIHTDSVQKKIIIDKQGIELRAGGNSLLKIQERESNCKIDMMCFRRDGAEPADEEYGSVDPNFVVFIPAEDYDPARSTPSISGVTWYTVTDGDTLSGKYIHTTASPPGGKENPVTSLIYPIPVGQSAQDWVLWARVLFINDASDSFYWASGLDDGQSWQPSGPTTDSSVGWKNSSQWMWVQGSSIGPAAYPRSRFLAPYVGMYSALMRAGLPVVTVHRPDFHEKLGDFKVLCLANEASLTDEQVEAVRQFVAAGGGLIATHETSLYDEKARLRPDFALADVFGVSYESMFGATAGTGTVEFTGTHAVTTGLQRLKVAHDEPCVAVRPGTGRVPAHLAGARRIPAVVVNEYGSGRVVYIPSRLASIQCEKLTPATERLFANAVKWVAGGKLPVEIEAAATVGVTLFDQYDRPEQPARRLLHLVNHNADSIKSYDHIDPIKGIDIEMRIPSGRRVMKLHRLWDKANVAFQVDRDLIKFKLGQLGEYEVIVVELR